mmetsp:Transcript_18821/g.42950  ORF Transcript_18821/g.42950 Transcript_18821/m.42950 type:complete len:94 (+) Transcript_18821:106-387(+)
MLCGVEVVCWAHNSKVPGSKPGRPRTSFYSSIFPSKLCQIFHPDITSSTCPIFQAEDNTDNHCFLCTNWDMYQEQIKLWKDSERNSKKPKHTP